jgi:hypothetical protein
MLTDDFPLKLENVFACSLPYFIEDTPNNIKLTSLCTHWLFLPIILILFLN